MPMLPSQWNNSAAQASLASPAPPAPEYAIPLWWYSGGFASMSSTGTTYYLQKGSTSWQAGYTFSSEKLHTLNSNWPANTKFALEVTMWCSTSGTVGVTLVDITASAALVSASSINTSSTTAQVYRSGQFTLTPGHSYGITHNYLSNTHCVTDVSLIVFP